MSSASKSLHIIIGGLERGGTQRNCVNIANMLFMKGHSVKITTVRKVCKNSYINELNDGVILKSLNHKRTLTAIISIMKVIIKIDKGSHILIMNYQLLPVIVFIAKFMGKKNKLFFRNMNFISKHMLNNYNFFTRFIQKYSMIIALPLIDIVIHQCKEMEKDFKCFNYFQAKQSIVINNVLRAINTKVVQKIEHKPYLLLVGKLLPQKNIKFAIDILKLFHDKHEIIDLIVIGEGKLYSELIAYAKHSGLSHHVKFVGRKDNMNDYYKSAYATILTSDYEGFPNVLIESIYCQTPVVAHNCKSGPSELIVNGVNGFLVEYQNANEFVTALKKVESIDRSSISSTIVNYLPENVYKQYAQIL
jgi:glycosyltransferase involved in cell wall biosynthesis